MIKYTFDDGSEYLEHYGILGQKWGKRNGPPYPLSASDRSSSEKKAGWRQSLNKESKKTNSLKYYRSHVDEYRKYQLENAKDPKDIRKYKKATDDELKEEIERRERMRKALLVAVGAVGVTAAVVYVTRSQAMRNIGQSIATGSVPTDNGNIGEFLKSVNEDTIKDLDFVINTDQQLKRVVGYKDFDLSKAGKDLFVATNELDADAYSLFIGNFTGKDRHIVDLKATTSIKAPALNKMRSIFDDELLNDSKFKDTVKKEWLDFVANKNPLFRVLFRDAYKTWDEDDWYYNAIALMGAHKGNAPAMMRSVLQQHGYNAMIDFHDVHDDFSTAPLIIFDPQGTLTKLGETRLTGKMIEDAAKNIAGNHGNAEFRINARQILQLGGEEYLRALKLA